MRPLIMTYYELDPEVAGGFGPNADIGNPRLRPLLIRHFHYEFDVWLGDPLLEAVGCYIVTESLKRNIQTLGASGVAFGQVEISKSGEFEDLNPNLELPSFVWLQVTGKPGVDDFGMSLAHRVVVSERVLDLLKSEGISHCGISPFSARQ